MLDNIEVNNLNVNCITNKDSNFSLDNEGNLIVKSITSEISNSLTFDDIYPIGSIYLSVNNINPASLFGGTWENFSAGRCLVGVDTTDTIFNESEKIGGEKTHKLNVSEMPAHTHGVKSLVGKVFARSFATSGSNGADILGTAWGEGGGGIIRQKIETWTGNHGMINASVRTATNPKMDSFTITATHEHNSVGGNLDHNNLQPFMTCYMWKRIA